MPVPALGTPTATDNCDDDVEIKYDGEVRVGEDDCSYLLQRTWTAIDECGLTHTLTQTITVLDTKGPELNKGAKVPTGETGMNVCYSDIPEGPTSEYIASLFSDNCGDVLVKKIQYLKELIVCGKVISVIILLMIVVIQRYNYIIL